MRIVVLTIAMILVVGSVAAHATPTGTMDPEDVQAIVARAVTDGAQVFIFDSAREFFSSDSSRDEVFKSRRGTVALLVEAGLLLKGGLTGEYPWHAFVPYDAILSVRVRYSKITEIDYEQLLQRIPEERREEFAQSYSALGEQAAQPNDVKALALEILLR